MSHFQSKNAINVTAQNPNRDLTANDVAGAKIIVAQVFASTQSPMYLPVDKAQVFERCSHQNNGVNLWYFQDYDFEEYRELPKGTKDYVIILGTTK